MGKQYTGWLALTVAIVALGQKLGGYENKRLAIILIATGSLLFAAFLCFLSHDAFRWWRERRTRSCVRAYFTGSLGRKPRFN